MGNILLDGSLYWPLSVFDHGIPLGYIRPIYCFNIPELDDTAKAEVAKRLENALNRAFRKWPFLSGLVGPEMDVAHGVPDNGRVKLLYHDPELDTPKKAQNFRYTTFTEEEYPYTWDDLVRCGFTPSMMDSVLSFVPNGFGYLRSHTVPAVTLQANFLRGRGLILCFAFHHSVSDGASVAQFIPEFVKCLDPLYTSASKVYDTHIPLDRLRSATIPGLDQFDEFDFSKGRYEPLPVERHPPVESAIMRPYDNAILVFSHQKLSLLKEACNEALRKVHEFDRVAAWVSMTDCICALLWVATMGARKDRLDPAEESHLITAVNTRTKVNPAFQREFYGNMFLHAFASQRVADLINGSPPGCTEQLPAHGVIANAAARIRAQITKIDHGYVSARYTLRSSITMADPDYFNLAWQKKADTTKTGLDFSSWLDIPASHEFDFGASIGKLQPECVRKTWSQAEGTFNILPRKGGTCSSSDWEVSIVLVDEDLSRLVRILESANLVQRVIQGPRDNFWARKRGPGPFHM